jgi:hypothetical protein
LETVSPLHRCATAFQESLCVGPLPDRMLRRDLSGNAWKRGERASSNPFK